MNGSSIQYIVELDKKARERVAEARRQADQIDSDAKQKTEQLLRDYRERSGKHLETVEQSYREETDKKISDIEKKKQEQMAAFDKALSENKEALENRIFNAVIGKNRGQ